MLIQLLRIVIALVGAAFGLLLSVYGRQFIPQDFLARSPIPLVALSVVICILFALIFYLLSSSIVNFGRSVARRIESSMSGMHPIEVIIVTAGLVLGLVIAFFVGGIVINIPIVGRPLAVLIYVFFAYVGIKVASQNKNELSTFILSRKSPKMPKSSGGSSSTGSPKILDTSVIIDGRIADIAETGFIEGPLIVSSFVLEELRHIADSSDDLKRVRGRRGLDILNRIQKNPRLLVQIHEEPPGPYVEVDVRLLKLAQEMDGKVVTNDYNLNKVAQFQGVAVLNINELANAVKPNLIPGEEMTLTVVKEGKEANQGVAYLDDGTMIVVQDGRRLMGQQIKAVVTSVLQTPAGRMIFVRPK